MKESGGAQSRSNLCWTGTKQQDDEESGVKGMRVVEVGMTKERERDKKKQYIEKTERKRNRVRVKRMEKEKYSIRNDRSEDGKREQERKRT